MPCRAPLAGACLIALLAGAGVSVQSQTPPLVTPTAGMIITGSVRFRPGTYRLPAAAASAAIVVRADGATIDLTGVVLEGADPLADPDTYAGTGMLVEDASGVTIQGGSIRGYKVGVLARRTPGLRVLGNTLSYNWKARLWSGIEKESLVDWMSYHDNEEDQWLRYGAAIYLHACDDCVVDRNTAVQGQNGLLVTRSARVTITNNTFSWNSAIGLGLYRTTDSTILHNRFDWDVRGYSHGFYNRGQDSSAIVMYEQSSRNVVAFNSATHGGDGLFLWAGQSTMDTGQGGANDNLFYGNDFSHAVANGIEATFSRNSFIANRIEECWHGVWGGYSFDSLFQGNTFARNTEAIAIEHGQNIRIVENTFKDDETAIRLWANPTQDPNWGYPKARDTRSRAYVIDRNTFEGHKVAFDLTRTTDVVTMDNRFAGVAAEAKVGVDVRDLRMGATVATVPLVLPSPPARLPDGIDAMLPAGALRGRSTIIVDEWGPYDYRSPKLWPAGKPADRPIKLRVLGPAGRWTVANLAGATIDRREGTVPGDVTLVPTGRVTDVSLQLAYVGGEVTTPRGRVYPAGAHVPFAYTLFEPTIAWTVEAWTFDASADPLTAPDAFAARLRMPAVTRAELPRLDLLSSRALLPDLPADRVALRAAGEVDLPAGTFDLAVISDDGVRVWVDEVLVIDRWSIHESVVDRVPVTGGRHRVRIEYFEMTGWAELQVRFVRRTP